MLDKYLPDIKMVKMMRFRLVSVCILALPYQVIHSQEDHITNNVIGKASRYRVWLSIIIPYDNAPYPAYYSLYGYTYG